MILKNHFLIFFVFLAWTSWAQQKLVKGRVFNAETKQPLVGTNIINMEQFTGTITDANGFFAIRAQAGDTLYFSYLGFKSYKMPVDSTTFGKIIQIHLQKQPIALQEVVIKGHDLTGILPVDLTLLPVKTQPRIKLDFAPYFGDKNPDFLTKLNDDLRKIMDPVGLLYNLFSARGKDLRKLSKMKEDDRLYRMLAARFDRQVIADLLNIPVEDVYRILQLCEYEEKFLREASDIQILEALKECYQKHRLLFEHNRQN